MFSSNREENYNKKNSTGEHQLKNANASTPKAIGILEI
jgi:hypothetical protein